MADNSAFISYRRGDGYPWARLIWDELQSRSINAFLDLESMRRAGRFDERILNQIAARPYFLIVLAAGSLDRCASESDWVRREIEHAIATNRTIVPLFIAPFETSHFPHDLPPHIGEALANSNGVTFYSQFLAAALDQLADFLQPVALAMGELTDDDAEFEQRAISQVRAEPPPSIPITPVGATPLASGPVVDAPAAVPPNRTDVAGPAGGSDADRTPPPDADASHADTTRSIAEDTASVGLDHEVTRPSVEPTPARRRKRTLVASAVAVALVVGGIVALTLLGDDEQRASTATTHPDTADDLDDEDATTTVTTAEPDVRRTDLQPNEWLEAGQSITTRGGELTLHMRPEGWLELTHHDEVIWEAGRASATPGAAAVMGDDGNFVLYRSRREAESSRSLPPDAALFSSATHDNAGAVLELRPLGDDAHLAVVLDGRVLWREPDPRHARETEPVTPTPTPTPTPSTDTSSTSTVTTLPHTSTSSSSSPP